MARIIFCIFLILGLQVNAEEAQLLESPQEIKVEENQTDLGVVQWAQNNLPQQGVLKESRGFVYLKVDDNYIYKLFPMLDLEGYSKPAYFRRQDSPGAHISVFYVNERDKTGPIKEIGQTFSFKISRLSYVPPKTQEYLVLAVESPQLEQLRESYGLSPLLLKHSFHITLAKKNKGKRHR